MQIFSINEGDASEARLTILSKIATAFQRIGTFDRGSPLVSLLVALWLAVVPR